MHEICSAIDGIYDEGGGGGELVTWLVSLLAHESVFQHGKAGVV